MKKYRNKNRNKKERSERIGFVTAFTVCIIAIGLAIGSTYASIGGLEGNLSGGGSAYSATSSEDGEAVGNELDGVTIQGRAQATASTTLSTEPTATDAVGVTEADTELPEADVPDTSEDKLQTIFQVSSSLLYPVNSQRVLKEYSEQAVYSETMQDYRAHLGTDFEAPVGTAVFSVCDGIVDDIAADDMYGNIVKITNGTYSVYYCGVSENITVEEGETVTSGQVIAQIGEIPCESEDEPHLHMEVRVSGNSIDPMTVISNDE